MRRDALGDVIDDRLLRHVPVLPDDVSARQLARSFVGNTDDGDVVDAGVSANQIFQFRWGNLKLELTRLYQL